MEVDIIAVTMVVIGEILWGLATEEVIIVRLYKIEIK